MFKNKIGMLFPKAQTKGKLQNIIVLIIEYVNPIANKSKIINIAENIKNLNCESFIIINLKLFPT